MSLSGSRRAGWSEHEHFRCALLQECGLDLVLDHIEAQPFVAVADNLLSVEFLQLPRPIEVFDGAVDGRCKDEEQDKWPQVRLVPEVLLFEECRGRKARDLAY